MDSSKLTEQEREMPWRCFFCDFVTSDRAEAAAHFGDRDDAEEFKPLCKWWARLTEDERVQTLQDTVQAIERGAVAAVCQPQGRNAQHSLSLNRKRHFCSYYFYQKSSC